MDPTLMSLLAGPAPDPAAAPAPDAGGGLPASIPDPEPHLAPDAGAYPDPAADPALPDLAAAAPDATGPATSGDRSPGVQGEVDSLKQLLGLAHDYMHMPGVEPKEAHEMAKAVTIITKLLSGNQEMHDKVSGSDPAIRKALSG